MSGQAAWMPTEESQAAHAARQSYQDERQAQFYDRERFSGRRTKSEKRDRQTLTRALDFLGAEGDVLDCPCGTGRLVSLLASRGLRVTGVDVSAEMLALARQVLPDLRCVQGDALALPFADRSLSAVISMRFLYHLGTDRERIEALREMARVSRKHGIVSFFDVFTLEGMRRNLKAAVTGRPPLRVTLSRKRFTQEASEAGWKVLRFFPTLWPISQHTIAALEKA